MDPEGHANLGASCETEAWRPRARRQDSRVSRVARGFPRVSLGVTISRAGSCVLYKIATAGRYKKSPNSRYISSGMNTTQLSLAVCQMSHRHCRTTHRSVRLTYSLPAHLHVTITDTMLDSVEALQNQFPPRPKRIKAALHLRLSTGKDASRTRRFRSKLV